MARDDAHSEMQALLNLIDEPDEGNFSLIRDRIKGYGPEALGPLEGMLDRYLDEVTQERIMELIQEIQFQHVYNDLQTWAREESHNLLRGFYIVARFQYPNLLYRDILAKLDAITRDVWLEMNDDLTALEKVKVLNHVIFDIHHFVPNRVPAYQSQSFHLNRLFETRKGSPLAMGVLYMLVARSLGIPIFGVNLPQHFVLAYTREDALEHDKLPGREEVLFYINPYNLGSVFTQTEIDLFLNQLKMESHPSFYAPCTNEVIIRRLINNLILGYNNEKKPEKSEALRALLKALSPSTGTEDPEQG